MKKILSIALVALLVASTAFAGFSGKASLSLGYDTESESYGFSNGKQFSVDLDVASETAEAVGEGEIFAGVKATLCLKAADRKGGNNAIIFVKDGAAAEGLGLILSLKEAYVAGQDWKVSITGTQKGPDFAQSAFETVPVDLGKDAFGNKLEAWWNIVYAPVSYAVPFHKAPGVTVTYKDWSVAAGFNGGKADATTLAPDFFNYHVSAISPEVAVAEGISVKIGAVASGVKNATEYNEALKKDLYKEDKNYDAFGASAQVAYAAEAFSAKVAGDFGMLKTVGTDDFKADFDVAANVAYAPVAVDVYFSRVKEVNYLSAQVSGAYEGISGDIYAQDILRAESEDITIGADAEYTVDAVTVGAGFGMTTDSKIMQVSGNVEYAAEKFTAKAGGTYITQIDVKDSSYLWLNASVESSAIIPGATISLGYGPNTDGATGKKTTNLLDEKYGSVTAQCVIAF